MAHPHSETVNTIFHWRLLGKRRGLGSASISEFLPFLTREDSKGRRGSSVQRVHWLTILGKVDA